MKNFTKHIDYIDSVYCKQYILKRNKPFDDFFTENCNEVHLPERDYNFLKEYFKERFN